MTPQEILEYNKRCANFLNWKYLTHQEAASRKFKPGWWKQVPVNYAPILHNSLYVGRNHKDLRFDYNWNLIMEVVEAIQKIRPLIISHNHCEIHMYEEGKNISINIATNSTITAVIQAINQFLIWYEQNKTA